MPASSEFVALCRSQVALLTQGLGATLSVVYLTQELVEEGEAKLIPVVIYPDTTVVWEQVQALGLLPEKTGSMKTLPRLLSAASSGISQRLTNLTREPEIDSTQQSWEENSLWRQRQIFLPLIHEGVVMGLLVTSRDDRPWNEQERVQIEQIAHTLAIACILDQRQAWLEQRLSQHQRLQAQQRDRFDDLLHQFRNPLTALRTFGKLLLRRLRPGDINREVASSIVRESDRLQDLLQQFDASVDLTTADLEQLTLSAASSVEAQPTNNPAEADTQVTSPLFLPDASLARQALILESCSVVEVLEPLLISARAIAQERNLNFRSEISTNLPPIQANAKALREVLSNLIDNALKYTPVGGQIHIRVDTKQFEKFRAIEFSQEAKITEFSEQVNNSKLQVAIAISNTGSGIPPQDLEHIFDRHYRGVQAATEIPGTGLGLAIAKELVEKMQGEIEVISPARFSWAVGGFNNLGAGTTFVVWLPIAQ